MISRFHHAALVGKYQAQGMRGVLEEIAGFLVRQGMEVSLEAQTALNTGITGHGALTPDELGQHCDLGIVVGGDGTMLGIARQLSRYGTPLVGINQGRFGFITDVNVGQYAEVLAPMIAGDYEEEHRTMLEGTVRRDSAVIFEGFAMNQHGGTEGGHRHGVRRQLPLRRLDHRVADGLDRVCAVGRRADLAPRHRGLGAGADRAP